MTVSLHPRAVLLDMDGTLVDSSAVVERTWTAWGREHGLVPEQVLSVIHGRQGHVSMGILLPERSAEENIADNALLLERETADVAGVVEIQGAGVLLAGLAGVPHALVTSASLPLARARMGAAGLALPHVVVTAEDVAASKPDPEGFLRAAELLGVAAADCVVFEDSAAGIEAGRSAGMTVVGVGPAAAALADHVVPDLTTVRAQSGPDGVVLSLA